MRKALVTGGCGFIGSHLTKKLVSEGWVVDVVDNMSGGKIENLEGLKTRTLLNSTFIDPYYNNFEPRGQAPVAPVVYESRGHDTVLVIQDDLSAPGVLTHISRGNYDVIFHQAAVPRVSYSVENPSVTTLENVAKTVALFEAASGNVDRIVWASSSSVYGGADSMPTHESERGKKLPMSPYAWQKFTIEDYLQSNLMEL